MSANNATPADDLATAREWLNRAVGEWNGSHRVGAYSAAVIGNGFIALAHGTASLAAMETTVKAREAFLDALTTEPEPSELPTAAELQCRIDTALSWLHEPGDPAVRMTKVRKALEGPVQPDPTLAAAVQREHRAADEARPHDDEVFTESPEEALRADRHAEITEAEASEEVLRG